MEKGTKVTFYVHRFRKWFKGYFIKPDEDHKGQSIILSQDWLRFEPNALEKNYGDWTVSNELIKKLDWSK